MKKLLQSLFILLFVATTAMAQNRTITGTVTSKEDGLPIPGVSVKVKGTNVGASTGANGKFSLSVPANATALEFSSIGFGTQTVNIGSGNVVNASLSSDSQDLSEVVVTGVGVATLKKKVAIAVETVKAEDMPKVSSASIDQALVGKVAGAQISSTSGQPGQQASILLRGINSLGSTQPMILVDGIQINAGNNNNGSGTNVSSRLSDLDLSNVDRVEVIQGAAAATIYGAQGANGVIQIFTKRGVKGTKPSISLSSQAGFDNALRGNFALAQNHFFNTDADGYIVNANALRVDETSATGLKRTPALTLNGAALNNKPYKEVTYDHLDRLFRKDILTLNSSLNVSGGSEAMDYALTLSQTKQNSVIKGGYDRFNLTGNLGFNLFKGFTARSITQVAYSENATGGITGANNINSAIGAAVTSRRYWDLLWRDAKGDLVSNPEGSNSVNPFYTDEYVDRLAKNTRIIQNFNFNYKLPKFLEFDYKFGIDNYRYDYSMYTKYQLGVTTTGAKVTPLAGRLTYDRDNETFLNSLFSAYFKTDFEKDFNLSIPIQTSTQFSYDWRKRDYQNVIAEGTGFAQYAPYGINATTTRNSSESITEFVTFGYLVNQRIDWGSLFGVSGGVRVDYSSAFGSGNKPFTFPRGDAYFNFGDLIKSNTLSLLKLRAAVGKAGIQPSAYARRNTLNSALIGTNGSLYTKATANNPELQVQVSTEREVGLDAGVRFKSTWFSNLNFNVTYWNRNSTDVIRALDISPSTGHAASNVNALDLESKGIQFSLDADVYKSSNFNWKFGTRFGHQRSIVTKIYNGADIPIGTGGSGEFVLKEGETVGAFFGYKALTSLDQTNNAGVRYIPAANVGNFEIVNGMVVNKATKAVSFTTDKFKIGDPTPKFNMSFINDFNIFKNLDVNVQLDWVYGNDIYNQSKQWLYRDYLSADFDKEITVNGQTGAFANYHASLYNTNQTNNFFIEKGSFLRLRNLSFAYNFTDLVKLKGIRSLRLSVTGRNLFTITDYSGLDPESAAALNNPLNRGLDLHNFPNMRTIQFGLNVGF